MCDGSRPCADHAQRKTSNSLKRRPQLALNDACSVASPRAPSTRGPRRVHAGQMMNPSALQRSNLGLRLSALDTSSGCVRAASKGEHRTRRPGLHSSLPLQPVLLRCAQGRGGGGRLLSIAWLWPNTYVLPKPSACVEALSLVRELRWDAAAGPDGSGTLISARGKLVPSSASPRPLSSVVPHDAKIRSTR